MTIQEEHVKNKIDTKTIKHRRLSGIVVSDLMEKTIIVKVERIKAHSKYKKLYKLTKRFKVHDETNEYKVGDKVIFEECRPMSKDKRWRVIKQI